MSTVAFSRFRGTRTLLQAAKATTKSSTSNNTGVAKAAAKPSMPTTTAASRKKAVTSSTTARSKSTASAAKQEVQSPKHTSRASGLLKLHQVSPALRSFLGVSETCQPHAIKEVWAYAKRHNLQNIENKREIFCDKKLKALFEGKEKVGFSDIGKMISQHIMKTA